MEKFETDLNTLHPVITECRVIKSELELALIQYANDVSSEAHVEVMSTLLLNIIHPIRYNFFNDPMQILISFQKFFVTKQIVVCLEHISLPTSFGYCILFKLFVLSFIFFVFIYCRYLDIKLYMLQISLNRLLILLFYWHVEKRISNL